MRVGEWDLHVLVPRMPVPGAVAVVYLAGFIVGGHSAVPLTVELAKRYRVFAPDLPGYGDSPGPARTLKQREQAEVVLGLLDALGVARASLVANSFAAQIAVEFAVRHPDRLERLVLIGPGIDAHGRTPFHQLLRFLRNSREEDAWVPGMTSDYFKVGPRRIVETAWYALHHRIEELLPRIDAPTLVVRGEKDMIVPHRWVAEVASLLPNGRLVEVPEYAHGVERTGAPTLARVIADFLDEPD